MLEFIPTFSGAWLNIRKIEYFTVLNDEAGGFYVVAVMKGQDDDCDSWKWVLSKHVTNHGAQRSLDKFMFHMGPVPNFECFENYKEYAEMLYNLNSDD
jgi:hypothetical protein